jgi:hypothetical protein
MLKLASLKSMINVLGNLYPEFLDDPEWSEFYAIHPVGLPLAVSLLNDVATLANDGEAVLTRTWTAFCEVLEINPEDEYDDYSDVWVVAYGAD